MGMETIFKNIKIRDNNLCLEVQQFKMKKKWVVLTR